MLDAAPLTPTRHLELEGALNLRDVGGYPTKDGRRIRWRTLLRSGCAHHISATSRDALLAMGMRTVVDLRGPSEQCGSPNALRGTSGVDYVPVSLLPDAPGDILASLDLVYRWIVDARGHYLVRAVRALAAPNALPALVHCTLGKDRTGLVIALVLDLAGVPREAIADDYALSEGCLRGPTFLEVRARSLASGHDWPTLPGRLISPPEYILSTLDYLDVE